MNLKYIESIAVALWFGKRMFHATQAMSCSFQKCAWNLLHIVLGTFLPFVVLGSWINFFFRAMLYGHLGQKLLILALLFHCCMYGYARYPFRNFEVNECFDLRNVLPHQWLENLLRLMTIEPKTHHQLCIRTK